MKKIISKCLSTIGIFFKKETKGLTSTRFKNGSYAVFTSVFIIVIAVFINLVVNSLPSDKIKYDLTSDSIYSLSDQTKQIVSTLDKDVNLYLLAITGNEDDTIARLLDRYKSLSKHINVIYEDPTQDPTFLTKYDTSIYNIEANSVLVECGDSFRLVSCSEIYVTSYSFDYYSYNYTTTTEFNGESALTNAIHYVSNENLPKVYILQGHGEGTLSTTITDSIKQENMEYENLSLLSKEEIPEDASAILIYAPTSDINEEEKNLLSSWVSDGGNILLISQYIEENQMTNLLSLANDMGLGIDYGLIVEGDSSMHLSRYPHYILPTINSHTITQSLIDYGYYILTPVAQPIIEIGSSSTITSLLTTSSKAYGKIDGLYSSTTEKESNDLEGPFTVGAISETGNGKFIWFTSSYILESSVDSMVSGANSDLILNALGWACGHEETISIRAKSLETTGLTITASQSSFWVVVMLAIIPLSFIATGIIITVRRKRK
ncbi:MAG: GldG family protein [Sphaerochaetaceae bacterium]|nr:GldG family protein [Sphaerochaetaceae bacterium]